MATQAQILDTAKSVDFIFDEFTRTARQAKLKAKLKGDMVTFKKIDKEWRVARDAKEEALQILEDQMMSTANVDRVLGEIKKNKARATKLLKKMRKAKKVLGMIEDAAKLAVDLVKELRKFT